MSVTRGRGTGRAPKRSGPEVRTHILQTATHLFAEHGFETVTTRDICTAANVSMSVVYRHFQDKQALYLECVVAAYRIVCDEVFAPVTEDLEVHTLLFRVTRNLCETHAGDADVPKLVLRQILERDYDLFRRLASEVTLGYSHALAARAGELDLAGRSPESIIHSLYAMTFGFAHMASQVTFFEWEKELPHHQQYDGMTVHILSLVLPGFDWTVFVAGRT